MLILRSSELLVRVDPSHGAEVLDLVELGSGRQLLGRPPFGSEPPAAGDLDEEPWTAAWRGGWQGCLPNAGSAARRAGAPRIPRARVERPWELVESDGGACRVRWEGHDWRRATDGGLGRLTITTEVTALDEDAPIVALEHLSLGLELIEPSVELELPGAAGLGARRFARAGHAARDCAAWPEIALAGGGTRARASAGPRSRNARVLRFARLTRRACGGANPERGHGVEVGWSADVLPHLLVWHEARGSGGVWRNATEVLCIEPCSVPHLLGLEAALEAGQARRLGRGETISWTMTVRPV